jgi:D-3-phosphoglycerate dehydrogenase / 2-oxoglutarate reductase
MTMIGPRGKILVTPRSVTRDGHPSLDDLRRAGYEVVLGPPGKLPTEEDLLRLLPGCVGYLAGVEKVPARVLEAAAGLRAISRNGAGVDGIDLEAARRLGIEVLRAAGANARGVAELTIGLILGLARSIPASDRAIKAGGWERRSGIELEGKTLGLVGCGRIGRLVARFALGLDMGVLAFDPAPDPAFSPGRGFRYAPFEEVIAEADVVSLHCPAAPGGRPPIDADSLEKMKTGVLIVNTARADLIDRGALAAALAKGRVAGAAFDVFDREPPGPDPLLADGRVVATPHLGAFTPESVDRAVRGAVDHLIETLGGMPAGG